MKCYPTIPIVIFLSCATPVESAPPSFADLLAGSFQLTTVDGMSADEPIITLSGGQCGFLDSLGVDHNGDLTVLSGPHGEVRFDAPDAFTMEEELTIQCLAPDATSLVTTIETIEGTYELVSTRLFIRDIAESMSLNQFFGGTIYPNDGATALDSLVISANRGAGVTSLTFR